MIVVTSTQSSAHIRTMHEPNTTWHLFTARKIASSCLSFLFNSENVYMPQTLSRWRGSPFLFLLFYTVISFHSSWFIVSDVVFLWCLTDVWSVSEQIGNTGRSENWLPFLKMWRHSVFNVHRQSHVHDKLVSVCLPALVFIKQTQCIATQWGYFWMFNKGSDVG